MWLTISGFIGNRVSVPVASGQSSRMCPYLMWLGSFLVTLTSLSQDGLQCKGFWEVVGRYYGLESPPAFWPLLNFPSWLSVVHTFLIGTSCCETTLTSSYYCAWPRWAVLVNGSLAFWCPDYLVFVAKAPTYLGSSVASLEKSLRAFWEVVL